MTDIFLEIQVYYNDHIYVCTGAESSFPQYVCRYIYAQILSRFEEQRTVHQDQLNSVAPNG
jgi:hypothetical protein